MVRVTFEAWGPVRGGCGHRHRSPEAAEKCRQKDIRALRSLGGRAYSDRTVWAAEADYLRPVKPEEWKGGAPA